MKPLSWIAWAVGLSCTGLVAQTVGTDAANQNELPEVRVTSGLLETSQFDAPGSVQAIDAAQVRASGPQVNLSDVLSHAAGVVEIGRAHV